MKHHVRAFACTAALFAIAACSATRPPAPPPAAAMHHHHDHNATSAAAPSPSVQATPAATLQPDAFDAPAPVSVEEAAKAGGEMSHSMHMPPPAEPPPHEHKHDGAKEERR